MNLYDLSAEYETLYQALEELGNEETETELRQAYIDTLEGLSGEFDEKRKRLRL